MGTPLGDFVRAKRDGTRPESVGLRRDDRARAPGLRRSDLASRAGISVEYLTRIEQGRDRNPSVAVLHALADGLSLDATERDHLRYLAKITGGECAGPRRTEPPRRDVRPAVRDTLRLLEPEGVALIMNRLGDVLAHTTSFELVARESGLLDAERPNLTRYVFTDPRSRGFFPDWHQVADERVFDLWRGSSIEAFHAFTAELAPVAGAEFTSRLDRHLPPADLPWHLHHVTAGHLSWQRETLELPSSDAQQLVVLLPADEATSRAMERLRPALRGALRAVT